MKNIFVIFKEFIYLILVRLPQTIIGKLKGNLIYTHWDRSLNNFGDCLSPSILKHYGFTPVYCQRDKSEIVLAGSILQWVSKDYKGIILGSGGVNKKYEFEKATILGVRGETTKRNIGYTTNELVLGDPGLVMNYVYPKKIKKKYDLGIVPHFLDFNREEVQFLIKALSNKKILLIDVLKNPEEVINNIKSCKAIYSSSLHGLIIADAFNIPNARFFIKDTQPLESFKWNDYYSVLNSVDIPYELIGHTSYEDIINRMRLHSEEVLVAQNKLNGLFLKLKNIV
jgi:pyruvyltransferase